MLINGNNQMNVDNVIKNLINIITFGINYSNEILLTNVDNVLYCEVCNEKIFNILKQLWLHQRVKPTNEFINNIKEHNFPIENLGPEILESIFVTYSLYDNISQYNITLVDNITKHDILKINADTLIDVDIKFNSDDISMFKDIDEFIYSNKVYKRLISYDLAHSHVSLKDLRKHIKTIFNNIKDSFPKNIIISFKLSDKNEYNKYVDKVYEYINIYNTKYIDNTTIENI